MGMVASPQGIASAFFVFHGAYGDVSRYAHERGVCRQWVYREAAGVRSVLTGEQQELERLRVEVRELKQRQIQLEQRLAMSVVIDEEMQAALATVGQARGVTLRDCRELLELLIPGKALSVASLGRRTQAAGKKAGELLAVLDEAARQHVREVAADEIYVKDPVLMVLEPESLCWISGHLSEEVSGEAWQKQFGCLPNLEQVTRDGGRGLEKGVTLVNATRQEENKPPVVDQGDHFHALWKGRVGLRKAELLAVKALAEAEAAQKEVSKCSWHGKKLTVPAVRASHAWKKAEKAMDTWQERERLWQQTKEALHLFTPTGALNTRPLAEAALAETLAQLPDADFAKAKKQLQKPEMLNYLRPCRSRKKSSRQPCVKRVCGAGRKLSKARVCSQRRCVGFCWRARSCCTRRMQPAKPWPRSRRFSAGLIGRAAWSSASTACSACTKPAIAG
jgi:hypothetical protein